MQGHDFDMISSVSEGDNFNISKMKQGLKHITDIYEVHTYSELLEFLEDHEGLLFSNFRLYITSIRCLHLCNPGFRRLASFELSCEIDYNFMVCFISPIVL